MGAARKKWSSLKKIRVLILTLNLKFPSCIYGQAIGIDGIKDMQENEKMTEATANEQEEKDKQNPPLSEEAETASNSDDKEESQEKEPAKEQEVDEKAKYLYLAAEMENMKRRFQRERENFLKYGNERILSSLLEVLDSFDRTVDALEGDSDDEKIKNIVKGVGMVKTQFLEVLKNYGVEVVETLGKEFDPELHEAVAQQVAEEKKDHEIIQEAQKGYRLNGRLLRAAKVIIVNNKSE